MGIIPARQCSRLPSTSFRQPSNRRHVLQIFNRILPRHLHDSGKTNMKCKSYGSFSLHRLVWIEKPIPLVDDSKNDANQAIPEDNRKGTVLSSGLPFFL